jgi:hypothetical protein
MGTIRYLVAAVLAIGAGAGTYFGIATTGLAGEGGLTGGMYSRLVIYPAVLLVGAFVFWIVLAAMDPGSER